MNNAGSWLLTRSTNDHLVSRSQMTRMIAGLMSLNIEVEFYEFYKTGHTVRVSTCQGIKLLEKG